METILLSGPSHDWLVVGSNGAIGSEITQALIRSSLVDRTQPQIIRPHPRETYGRVCLELLQNRPEGRPLRLLFCGGKGGFSLPESSADQQQLAFEHFCTRLGHLIYLEKFIYISSSGAKCSRAGTPYSRLISASEDSVTSRLRGRSLILRLPSIYGYSTHARQYHGLIGIFLQNLRSHRPTGIYARMETRRSYLSIHRLSALLVRDQPGGAWLERSGCLNIQSSMSMSIFDVCSSFYRALRMRPVVKLMRHSSVDAEHHYPSAIQGAKVIVNDPIGEWLRWQWMRSALLSPS